MSVQYNAPLVEYNQSDTNYNGLDAETLSAQLTLGASVFIVMKKKAEANLDMSAFEYRFVDGIADTTVSLQSAKKRKFRRIHNVTQTLSGYILKKPAKLLTSATLSLSSSIKKITEKAFYTSFNLAASLSKAIFTKLATSLYLTSNLGDSSIKQNIETEATLGASVFIRIAKQKAATIILISATNKFTYAIKIATLGLSAGYKRMFRYLLQAGITLFVARIKLSKKILETTIILSSNRYRAIRGLANVPIALNADIEKVISTFIGATFSLAATKAKKFTKKVIELTTNIGAIVGGATSYTISAGLTIGAESFKFVKKAFGGTINIGTALGGAISLTIGLSFGLTAKVYKRGLQVLGAGLSAAAVVVKKIVNIINTDISMSSDAESEASKEETLETSMGLVPSVIKFIKKIFGSALQLSSGIEAILNKAGIGGDISLGASVTIFVKKAFGATITLSGDSSEDADLDRTFTTAFSVGAEVIIFVKKGFETTLNLSATEEEEPEPHCDDITYVGANGVAELIGGLNPAFIYLHLGSGTTPYTVNDTQMEVGIGDTGLAPAVATTSNPANRVVRWTHTWTATGSKTVSESGVSSNIAVGGANHLLFRTTFPAITLENGDTITITHNLKVL